MNSMTDVEWAWLSGLLDADGSFRRHDHDDGRFRLYVVLEMIDRDLVERAHRLVGLGRIIEHQRRGKAWQKTYRWHIQRKADCVEFMTAIRPLMGERRQAQIDACLR